MLLLLVRHWNIAFESGTVSPPDFYFLRLGWVDGFLSARGKTVSLFENESFCICPHVPVCTAGRGYWFIGKLHFFQTRTFLSELAQLQFPFVFNSPDLINGNYFQACVIKTENEKTIVLICLRMETGPGKFFFFNELSLRGREIGITELCVSWWKIFPPPLVYNRNRFVYLVNLRVCHCIPLPKTASSCYF